MHLEHKTVYYLVDSISGRRIKYYSTLGGARIAQRLRNLHLGFTQRENRHYKDGAEYELCTTLKGERLLATYIIVEDQVEIERV